MTWFLSRTSHRGIALSAMALGSLFLILPGQAIASLVLDYARL
jgi:hypothetical protein